MLIDRIALFDKEMRMSDIAELERIAKNIRYDLIAMAPEGGRIHWGGCLSQVDILTALYFKILKIDPNNPDWPDRDRFILSKGHGSWSLYVAMAHRGYFSKERLKELDKDGGDLPKHADRLKLSGIEVSCGALAQGLSVGLGMALAGKLDNAPWRVYVLIGDGECMEGQIYEAMLAGGKQWSSPPWLEVAENLSTHRLNNITVIIDKNKITLDERIDKVMDSLDLSALWQAAGWEVLNCNGNDIKELMESFERALEVKNRPQVIIADTVKGKGISLMEDDYRWHIGTLSKEQTEQFLRELEV